MRRLVIKTAIFCFLVLLIVKNIEKYFIKENRFNNTNFTFNKFVNNADFDILFFGSSKSYCSYNPTIFKDILRANSFNLGGQGQILEVTNFVLEESLKKSKPKLIVVDISHKMVVFDKIDSLAKKAKSYQLEVFDNFSLSLNKIKYLNRVYSNKELLYVLSPLIRNHSNWIDIKNKNYKKEFLEDKNNFFLYNNGYIGTMYNIKKNDINITDKSNDSIKKLKAQKLFKVSTRELQVIKEIKAIADKKNIDILFVSAPSLKGYASDYSYYENLEKSLNEIGFNYVNLNNHFSEIGLDLNDFKDIQHLNYSGGFKTSQYLAKYILNNYEFKPINKVMNSLDNNITYHLITQLINTKKILKEKFLFNESISIDEIGYFKESIDRYVFIFKPNRHSNIKQMENYRGYIRYYISEINEENKRVYSFPMKIINIENQKYLFARVNLNKPDVSKLDIFFMKKETSKASKVFSLNRINLK